MIHGPCGAQNTNSPCMINGKCTKYFSKKCNDNTIIDEDWYPIYRRRYNVCIKKGETFIDNKHAVSYNRQLFLLFNAHINVEWFNQSR
jgi:hypothetical protein